MPGPLELDALARCHRDDLNRERERLALSREVTHRQAGTSARLLIGRAMIWAGEALAGLEHRPASPDSAHRTLATTR